VLKYLSRAKKFLKKPVKVFGILCPKKVILQLVNMAKKIHQFMDNARAEWEMEGDTIYLNDLSFEKNEITDKFLVQKQISLGEVKGEIRLIQDLEELRNILRGRSIVPEKEYYEAARSSQLQQY
jgi:hypothetical protein